MRRDIRINLEVTTYEDGISHVTGVSLNSLDIAPIPLRLFWECDGRTPEEAAQKAFRLLSETSAELPQTIDEVAKRGQ